MQEEIHVKTQRAKRFYPVCRRLHRNKAVSASVYGTTVSEREVGQCDFAAALRVIARVAPTRRFRQRKPVIFYKNNKKYCDIQVLDV